MTRNVLIVDDDKEMLLSLKEGLQKYSVTFSVLIAEDGFAAIEEIKQKSISLVVTDLKMPRMNGFALLSYIAERYAHIPVLIMTAYGTAEMDKLAHVGGAVGYIEKPFLIEDMGRQIIDVLKKESEGGKLQGVSSGMFLQFIEMEQKTCTIRLLDNKSKKHGVLFFKDGELFEARTGEVRGINAAYEIFSWDEVNLSIQNECFQKDKKIDGDLQAILLEAMRLKDEKEQTSESPTEPKKSKPKVKATKDVEIQEHSPDSIRRMIEKGIGEMSGVEDVSLNNSWDGLVAQMKRIGSFFDTGKLKLVYVDTDEPNDLVLVAGQKTIAVSVNSRCPRERLIEALRH